MTPPPTEEAGFWSSLFPISDPVLIFALVTALILTAPIVMARWRMPGMIGLLVAGAVLGPNALGILARDQSFVLLGTVGLLYIMFTAALEIDLSAFKRYKVHGIVFGTLTFALPQGFGTVVARYLFGYDWMSAVLLGSVIASHTLLAYPIVSRLGIAKGKAVTMVVGGTMIADTTALLVLAVVAGSTRGEMNEAFVYRLGLLMLLYVGGILFGLPRLGRWFFRNVRGDGAAEFVFVLTAVFTCAALSHVAGVEPIVGAFLSGLALNKLIPHNSPLMNRIQFTGEAIFVPFFLLSVGMLLDVRVFLGGFRSWLVMIGLLVALFAGKYLAAELVRPIFRFSRDESRVVFGLSIAQAAATLATTMVGYEIGLFDEAVVNAAIVTILVTCVVAPWLTDRHGRRIALAAEKEGGGESSSTGQRILVPVSEQGDSDPLIALALLVRDRQSREPIHPLAVVPDADDAADQIARAKKKLAQGIEHLSAADVPAQPLTRIDINTSAGILRTRREIRATHTIVDWSQRTSTGNLLFRSVFDHLVEDPEFTLLTAHLPQPLNTTGRVLFVIPPNAEAERAFQATSKTVKLLAGHLNAPIHVVAERSQQDGLKKRLQQVSPKNVDVHAQPLEQWESALQSLVDNHREGDLLVFYGVRKGGLAWRGDLERLLDQVAQRFASTNLIALYGAEPREDSLTVHTQTNPIAAATPDQGPPQDREGGVAA